MGPEVLLWFVYPLKTVVVHDIGVFRVQAIYPGYLE